MVVRHSYTKAIIRTSKNRLSKYGTTEVLIYYHHQTTEYFKTSVWINPKDWDKIQKMVSAKSGLKNLEKMNDEIYSLIDSLNTLVHDYNAEHLTRPTGNELRRLLSVSRLPESNINSYLLLKYFERWIQSKKKKVSKATISVYEQTLKYLEKFIQVEYGYMTITYKNYQFDSIEDINLRFLEAFRDWLGSRKSRSTKKNLSNTTINKQIRNVHKFLRDRNKSGDKINANAFNIDLDRRFSKRVFLTESDIQKIIELDISKIEQDNITNRRKQTLSFVKDVFIFNLLFGIRVGDLFDLKKQDVFLSDKVAKDNYILIITEKTDTEIKFPLFDGEAKKVVIKYLEHDTETEFLFPVLSVSSYNNSLKLLAKYAGIDASISHPIFSNGKRIANRVPKWKKISSHSIRKTSINRNILDYGRDIAKYLSTHNSESGFQPYEDVSDYDKIFDNMIEKSKKK